MNKSSIRKGVTGRTQLETSWGGMNHDQNLPHSYHNWQDAATFTQEKTWQFLNEARRAEVNSFTAPNKTKKKDF